jgi:hypothetical protein
VLRIQKLDRPTKRSGVKIEPGAATMMRGVRIVNQNKFSIWVDKFTPQAQSIAKKRKATQK